MQALITGVPLAVIAADIHLRQSVWGKHPTLLYDTYDAFIQVVQAAKHYGVPLFLLGDIFNSIRPDAESVTFFQQTLADAGIPVWYIQGNHDMSDPPWPAVSQHAKRMHHQCLEAAAVQNCAFYGLDYISPLRIEQEIAAIPPHVKVVMMHQCWAELQRIGQTDGSLLKIPGDKLVLTGDYHVRLTKTFTSEVDGKPLMVHSPGSTSAQAIDEPVDKFCSLLTSDSGSLQIFDVPIVSRPRKTVRIDSPESLAYAVNSQGPLYQELCNAKTVCRYNGHTRLPILKVVYDERIPAAYNQLTSAFGTLTHLFLSPKGGEVEEVAVDANNTVIDNLHTAVVALAQKEEVRTTGLHLLDTKDIQGYLQERAKDLSFLTSPRLADATQTHSS